MKDMKKILFLFVGLLALGTTNVKALEMSDEFKAFLTEGKFVVNSIKPTSEDMAAISVSDMIYEKTNGCYVDEYTENLTKAKITCPENVYGTAESHIVELSYNYDEAIKKVIDDYVAKLPEGKDKFAVSDLELINYWVYGKGDPKHLSKYSGEFKKLFDYKNFYIDVRMGEETEFYTASGGNGKYVYDDTIYKITGQMLAEAAHVIYVPTGTTNEKAMEVAQERIDDYIGEGKVVLSIGDNVNDYIETALQEAQDWDIQHNMDTYDWLFDAFNDEDGQYHFLKSTNIVPNWYNVVVDDNETSYKIVIIKDSSKMIDPKYQISDLKSDIVVSTDSNEVPLDTLIKVRQLTSGTEYDKIIKILNIANNEMFDLNLYSGSLEQNFTKLKDGTFEVRIPISDAFKGKDLIIYYIKEDGTKVEYEVTVKNGFGIFYTDHFSIYTLAAKEVPVMENPNTFDGIINSILLGNISLMGVIGCTLYVNKKKIFN